MVTKDDEGQLLEILTPDVAAMQAELVKTKEELQKEIKQRCWLEKQLKAADEQLQKQVAHKTEELLKANKLLQRGICDRIATEAQLLQTTSELQELFQAFPDIYLRLKSDGTILSYHARETSGWHSSPKEFLGKPIQASLPPDVGEQVQQAILQVQQTNALVAIEYSLQLKAGKKSFEARLLPSITNQIIVIVRDITERKQAQEALQQSVVEMRNFASLLEIRVEERTCELKNINERLLLSEERFARAINAGKVGIWEWNIQTNEMYIDSNFKAMLGYADEEISQHFDDWLLLIHPDDIEAVLAEFNAYVEGLIPKYEIEHRMLHKNGSYMWYLERGTVVRDANNKACFIAGSNTDITAKKQVENQLKASLKEKEVLLKEIHHRVKNNLQIISSLLRLQAGYIKDEKALEIFQDSQNRVKAMAMIHENLYQSNDIATIDFSNYLRKLTNNLMHFYKVNSNIKLTLNIGKVLLKIDNAISCGLIINELVSNSIKHAFTDCSIGEINVIFSALEPGKYLLTVSDNGVGIAEDIESRKKQSLGLQLVWNLVEQLEGTIAFNNTMGTLFKITFND